MGILTSLLTLAQVLSAIGVIILVLLQHGKGADMGAAFGSGASGSLFGATGSANFLSRLTGAVAACFFVTTLALSYLANHGMMTRSPAGELEKRLTTGVTVKPVDPAAPASGAGSTPGAAPTATTPAAAAPAATPAASSAAGASVNPPKNDAAPKSGGPSSEIPK
jgi:preprotein translocase subunit SecG